MTASAHGPPTPAAPALLQWMQQTRACKPRVQGCIRQMTTRALVAIEQVRHTMIRMWSTPASSRPTSTSMKPRTQSFTKVTYVMRMLTTS